VARMGLALGKIRMRMTIPKTEADVQPVELRDLHLPFCGEAL